MLTHKCTFPHPDEISRKGKSKDSKGPAAPPSTASSHASSNAGASPPYQPGPPSSVDSVSSSGQTAKFDIASAFPEGFDFAGTPLGWDRASSAAAVGTFLEAALMDSLRTRTAPPASDQNAQAAAREAWLSSPIFTTPNFLAPWFPTQQEQSLILHYCANAADLMMAIPTAFNPMMAINLPMALNMPRGADAATDALRISLLATGAVHQAFLLARSNANATQTSAMFQYAANLRDVAKSMIRSAPGATSEAALSACTSLASLDILFGGTGWQENFELAKLMVASRGGPAKLLETSAPTQLSEGMTVTPSRLILEVLTIYETLGCLTTGREPELLTEDNAEWWFQKPVNSPMSPTAHNFEHYSVENQFGVSKVIVHLMNGVARLLARIEKYNRGEPLPELSASSTTSPTNPLAASITMPTGFLGFDSGPSSVSSSTVSSNGPTPLPGDQRPNFNRSPSSSSSSVSSSHTKELARTAKSLLADINLWIDNLTNSPNEIHERVQVGNQAYAYTMKILILTTAFGISKDSPIIQEAAEQVLQNCSFSTAALGMSLDLMWPAIVAGSCFAPGNSRQWALTLFEGFKSQCCFDVDTASTIINEVWRRSDAGLPRADWKPVCDDFGLQVLLC